MLRNGTIERFKSNTFKALKQPPATINKHKLYATGNVLFWTCFALMSRDNFKHSFMRRAKTIIAVSSIGLLIFGELLDEIKWENSVALELTGKGK